MAELPAIKEPKSGTASLYEGAKGISELLKIFTGQKQNTSSTESSTSGLDLSPEAVNYLLQSLMESNSGLAAVAGSAKAPGLYNATSRNLLVNDLIARAAGEVATKGAKTVSQRSLNQQQVTPGQISPTQGLLGTLGGVAAKAVLPKILDSIFKDTSSATNAFPSSSYDFTGGGLDKILGDTGGFDFGSVDSGFSFASSPDAVDAFSSFGGSSSLPFGSGGDFGGYSDALNFGDAGASWGASNVPWAGAALTAISGDFSSESLRSAAGQVLGSYFGPVGSFIGGKIGPAVVGASESFWQGIGGDTAVNVFDPFAGLTSENVDYGQWLADQLNPVGNLLGLPDPVGDFISGGCFITTATCEIMGKADDCEELQTLRGFRDTWMKQNYPAYIDQYYAEAPTIVKVIKAHVLADELFRYLYHGYIEPAVKQVKEGKFEEAFKTYVSLFNLAKQFAYSEDGELENA